MLEILFKFESDAPSVKGKGILEIWVTVTSKVQKGDKSGQIRYFQNPQINLVDKIAP